MEFGFLSLAVLSVLLFIILLCISFFIISRRQSESISLLSAVIPPIIIIAIIITVGDFLWRADSRYVPSGKGEEYEIYTADIRADLQNETSPTDEDLCVVYLHPLDEDEEGMDYRYAEPSSSDIAGDVCIPKNLFKLETGHNPATIAIHDAKPNPHYPLSIFSFKRADKFYIIRLP